jgi:hypothetical protein
VIDALSTVTGEHAIPDDRGRADPPDRSRANPPDDNHEHGRTHEEAGAAAGRHWSPGGPEDVTPGQP